MILGIDAGIKGGFVILSKKDKSILLAKKTPLIPKTKTLDSKTIISYMQIVDDIILEEQFSIAQPEKRQNPKSDFTTAYNYGKLCALGEIVKPTFGIVHPNTWQSAYTFAPVGIRKTKKHHIALAKSLAGKQADMIVSDGVADAYLIARNSLQRLEILQKRNPLKEIFYNLFKRP